MEDFTLSVDSGNGWSGEGCWLAGGIMFLGSMSGLSDGTGTRTCDEVFPAPPDDGHSDIDMMSV